MSTHVLIRLIRFVSRFTIYLCNAIYFSTTFSIPCKRFKFFLHFDFMNLIRAYIYEKSPGLECDAFILIKNKQAKHWKLRPRNRSFINQIIIVHKMLWQTFLPTYAHCGRRSWPPRAVYLFRLITSMRQHQKFRTHTYRRSFSY